ncbi:MAG: Uma2 family endonuclease [Planctomycetota bacterium]
MSATTPEVVVATPIVVPPAGVGPYRLADYLERPDEPRVELIFGRYHMSPAPINLHQIISIELSAWLLAAAKTSGGLGLAAPNDVVLKDDTVVQPDLLYFSKDRRPPLGARFTTPPDLVIEILSPSHHTRDRVLKLGVYADAGVAEYWIVDPAERGFEFLVLVDGKYQVQPIKQAVYQSPALHEVSLDLPAFWGEIDKQLKTDTNKEAP